jgi:ribonuclease HI
MNKKFYAVWKGAKTGVFDSWAEVQQYTNGRSDAQFMGFPSKVEAQTAFASTYTKALMKRSLKSSPALSKSKVSAASTPDESQNAQVQADIEIYCDGACSPNPGKSGTGLCVYQAGKLSALYYGLYEVMGTNNTAELNGLLQSMKLAQFVLQKGDKRIVILSDSKYSIDCITKWSRGWKAKGWKKGKGEEIKNLELIKTCFNLYESLKTNVSIKHVKGHANIEGNELADRMAVYARLKKQTDFVRFEETLDIKAILAMESG